MLKAIQNLVILFRSLGPPSAFQYVVQRLCCRFANSQRPYTLHSKDAKYPLTCRGNSSDTFVFHQIFVHQEYSLIDFNPEVGLVIDCGANVGYSAAYFLTRFPNCHLIAVEPSPANFSMLETNLRPYGERVSMIRSAVWSYPTGLKMVEQVYRDGKEWSYQVRECRGNETPDHFAVDIGTLLSKSKYKRISVLKMDIEGAEAVVFSENFESWLNCVDMIIVELHDDTFFGKASETFYAACSSKFSFSKHGELTVCKRTVAFCCDLGSAQEQSNVR